VKHSKRELIRQFIFLFFPEVINSYKLEILHHYYFFSRHVPTEFDFSRVQESFGRNQNDEINLQAFLLNILLQGYGFFFALHDTRSANLC